MKLLGLSYNHDMEKHSLFPCVIMEQAEPHCNEERNLKATAVRVALTVDQ